MDHGKFKINDKGYKILTPSGYQDFKGIQYNGKSYTRKITFDNDAFIECTMEHPIYIGNDTTVRAGDLKIDQEVLTTDGFRTVVSVIETCNEVDVYDIIGVDGGHRYYANGVLVSNCEFISFEETLISSIKLNKMQTKSPLRQEGNIRWYKDINPTMTYVVALDPAMGTGRNYSAIQVFELPSLEQVAEWQHNRTTIEGQIRVLKDVLKAIQSAGVTELYWSVETNTLGEAALVVIRDTGEETFPGEMVSDPTQASSNGRRRKGFVTSNKSKVEACAKLKTLIEGDRMKINSRALVSELKNYVARGASFEARQGTTDDLVSACLLFVRIADYVSKWEDSVHRAMNSNINRDDDGDDMDVPMPMILM